MIIWEFDVYPLLLYPNFYIYYKKEGNSFEKIANHIDVGVSSPGTYTWHTKSCPNGQYIIWIDMIGDDVVASDVSEWFTIHHNTPPNVPEAPSGQSSGIVNIPYIFYTLQPIMKMIENNMVGTGMEMTSLMNGVIL